MLALGGGLIRHVNAIDTSLEMFEAVGSLITSTSDLSWYLLQYHLSDEWQIQCQETLKCNFKELEEILCVIVRGSKDSDYSCHLKTKC